LFPQDRRAKVIRQLADIYIELHAFPFDSMGSLDTPGSDHVGPFARESLTDCDAGSGMRQIGPVSSREGYFRSSIQLTLELIVKGELLAKHAVDAFLIYCFLLDALPRVV
ncbi:hypothetical protein BO71DRAFT_284891, partial [Aspergillus ellipticus CBS 707.79]